MSFRIRDAAELDLSAILAIEQASFSDAWTAGMFRAHIQSLSQMPSQRRSYESVNVFFVAEEIVELNDSQGAILGFVLARIMGDEAEILNIAVASSHRGQGIGSALLDKAMSRCAEYGGTSIFLEVRESNSAAQALYASRHFTLAGRRKSYYQSPLEDGLILRANLSVSTGNPAKSQ